MPRSPRWTDQDLIDAVGIAANFKELCELLDVRPGGGTYRTLERHIARLGLDAGRLGRPDRRSGGRPRQWTEDELTVAVQESRSLAEVARRLGYQDSDGIHRFLVRHVRRLALDIGHFTGRSWAKGRVFPGRGARPLAEILVKDSPYLGTSSLRLRLIAEGVKPPCCEHCGAAEWRGQPLPLELDHINGDHADNRIENLRILRPNCHAVTETWCRSTPEPA